MNRLTPDRAQFVMQQSSSDDDPPLGQVTPHHLVSPAMRRAYDSDPASDSSDILLSPISERVARKFCQNIPSSNTSGGVPSRRHLRLARLASSFDSSDD